MSGAKPYPEDCGRPAATAADAPTPELARAGPSAFNAKLKDIASGAPLYLVNVFVFAGVIAGFGPELRALAKSGDVLIALQILEQLATLAFGALQMALFILRNLPLRKAHGVAPRAVALLSANFGFAFVLLPRVPESPLMLAISTSVTIVGLAASIYCAGKLGRAFSILPQARGFVSDGPYRFVRHPLYLAEQVTTFGICFQFLQPWALLIALGSLALQIVRMGYEEQVLAETFPEYRAYAARTARLIPGVY